MNALANEIEIEDEDESKITKHFVSRYIIKELLLLVLFVLLGFFVCFFFLSSFSTEKNVCSLCLFVQCLIRLSLLVVVCGCLYDVESRNIYEMEFIVHKNDKCRI